MEYTTKKSSAIIWARTSRKTNQVQSGTAGLVESERETNGNSYFVFSNVRTYMPFIALVSQAKNIIAIHCRFQ